MEDIGTKNHPLSLLYAAFVSSTIPSDLVPTTVEPTGDGVLDLNTRAAVTQSNGVVLFAGVGTPNQTGFAKVWSWEQIGVLWVPTLILDLNLSLGGAVGVNGSSITTSQNFINVITANSASAPAGIRIYSPGSVNGIAKVCFDLTGSKKFQVLLGKGTVTSLNALAKVF